MILEGIVTTESGEGDLNIAPMGPRVDADMKRLLSDVKRDLPKPVEPAVLTAEIARLTGRERRRARR